MAGRRLFFQIYPYFLLVAALSIVAVAWHASRSFKEFHIKSLEDDLALRCGLASESLLNHWTPGKGAIPESVCMETAGKASARLTLIDPAGHVLFDSEEEPAKMGDHSGRPEFIAALSGSVGSAVRYSATLNKDMLYVAIPIAKDGRTAAILRMAIPATRVDDEMKELYVRLLLGGLGIAAAVALLSLLLSRSISHPIDEMRKSACRIAAGELDHRIPSPNTEELSELSTSLNRMAGQLKRRLHEITQERNEREAILSSMSEGVIAIDSEARIISVNNAAATLLKLDGIVEGRLFHEAVRNSDLQDFVTTLLAGPSPTVKEAEIEFNSEIRRILQVKGGNLKDSSGSRLGALIVVNDISRLRQLEDVRRDFVANVSHEIKTPVTAIKGSAETLLDGAMADPEAAARFLKIIAKHAERLNSLVEDILSLASVEAADAPERMEMSECHLKDVLDTAASVCREKADARRMTLETSVDGDIVIKAARPLLEQAIVNLVDNAVKYSDEGSKVEITGRRRLGRVDIAVRDHGAGIAKEHLPRLFERFYRVDKARSRKLGGTGLGLAIVKHIVQTHNGSVGVESEPGKGSTFTITLP